MRAAGRLALALVLLVSSPGTNAFLAFAGDYEIDPVTHELRAKAKPQAQAPAVEGAPVPIDVDKAITTTAGPAAPKIKAALRRIASDPRLADDQRQQAADFLTRYQNTIAHDPDHKAQQALDDVVKDLADPKKDPGLALAGMFDRLQDYPRRAETGGTYVQYMKQDPRSTLVRVGSDVLGKTLFYQQADKLNTHATLKTITRPGADGGPADVEAIIREEKKGAATEQRVLYNRRVHQLFANLKKLYFDQCNLVRRINNGQKLLTKTVCSEPQGIKDDKLTDETREKLTRFYENNQSRFPPKLLAYLQKLDALKAAGKLGELHDYKELEEMQRLAMAFYNKVQLESYQRAVIMEITGYISSALNVQPKRKRGEDQLDLGAQDLKDLQDLLDQFHNGKMEGYGQVLKWFGFSQLSENDVRVLGPKVMALASEAFADVAYAAKAQGRLISDGGNMTGAEQDAAIEEAGQWIRLAQIQIQQFELESESMNLEHLAQGKLRGIGIQASDKEMIARAEELSRTARDQYLPQLDAASQQVKKTLMRQTAATFYTTYRDLIDAFLYNSSSQERVRLLAGKADQLLQLYLSWQFDVAIKDPKYGAQFSAAEKVQGGAYSYFLSHLPANVEALKGQLEEFVRKLKALDGETADEVRKGLLAVDPEFRRLMKAVLGDDSMPTPVQVQKESQRDGLRQGRIFAATADFANDMRLFDMVNELNIYVDKYASNKWISTQNDTAWTQLASFQWVNKGYDWISGGFMGHSGREASADWMLQNVHLHIDSLGIDLDCRQAFEMLKAHPERREVMDRALRAGDWRMVALLAAQIDPVGAERMKIQGRLDKLDEDKADMLDLEGLMAHAYTNDAQASALGGVSGGFKQLPTLIKGYAAATAVTDIAITTVLTAVGGPLISWASRGAEYLVAGGKFIEPVEAINAAEKVGTLERTINFGARFIGNAPGKILLEYPGKVILNTGRTFRKVLALPAADTLGGALGQIATGSTWRYAFKSAVSSTLMMGGISGVMQGVSYEFDKETSQYTSVGDAMSQGFVQGASFGAKAGLLMHMSPLPVTAFEGKFGGFMQTVAESPGPLNSVTRWVARVVPGLSESAVAEAGPLGAVAKVTQDASGFMYGAGKAAVWAGGMVDGTLKYMAIAWAPEQAVQLGSMLKGRWEDQHGKSDPTATTASGSTVYMERLAGAQAFSQTFSQISWVLMPSNPAFSPKEIKDQVQQARLYNRVMNMGDEQIREIVNAPNDKTIEVVKPWWQRSVGEHLRSVLGGWVPGVSKPASTETFTVNSSWRQMAARKRLKGESLENVIALALAPSEGNGQVVEFKTLRDGVSNPKFADVLKGHMPEDRAGPDGRIVTSPGSKDPMDIRALKILDVRTGKWRDAREGEARLVEVKAKPGENARPAELQVFDASRPKGQEWVAAGTAGAPVARVVESGTDTQVRITNESVAAAKEELEARLKGGEGADLRSRILLAGDRLQLGEGLIVDGVSLRNLRRSAALAQVAEMRATSSPAAYGKDLVSRAWDDLTGTKLETRQQRSNRYLRQETDAEAQRIAGSPELRLDAVREQVKDLRASVQNEGDQATLEKVSRILGDAGQKADAGGVIGKAVQELDAAARAKGAHEPGLLADTYANLAKSLRGEVTADLVMTAARRRLQRRIDGATGADKAALLELRQSLETDASRQVVIAEMFKAFGGSREQMISSMAKNANARDVDALDRAVDLYMDVWERAAFGQMAGERVMKDGKLVWSIPSEREFKNRFNIAIAEFRPLQKRVIKETLGFIAKGDTLIFGQMPTGGGKTLTNFTLIEFLDALAHEQGREGVIYLTTNPDLVTQAREDYIAFFGKKPAFEIMTYGDLSARVAQAKEQGLPSPMAKFHLVGDEGDRPASEVPTSVGLFNGRMSRARVDPVQRALQDSANRFVDGKPDFWQNVRAKHGLGEGEVTEAQYQTLLADPEFKKAILEGDGGFYRQVQLKYGLSGTIADAQFAKLMENKDFAADFNKLVKETDARVDAAYKYLKSSRFRDGIDLTQYPEYLALYKGDSARARAELQRTIIEEYKHMVHTADLLHGGFQGRLRKFFKGGLEFASEPDRSKKLVPDPDPNRSVLNFNNGIAYDNLSTDVGPFGSAYYRRPIANEFESAGTMDFSGLIEESVKQKSVFFLTSGTCAAKIRRILIERYGAKFTGETSVPDPYKARLIAQGESPVDVDAVWNFVHSAKEGRNLYVQYANTLEDAEVVRQALSKRFKDANISVLVRPGSNLEEAERYSEGVKGERNLRAFDKGEAEVVFIIGAAGLRGLEMNLSKYHGRESWMDILDPQELDTDSMTQLIGRLSIGRAWMLNLRRFTSATRVERLASSSTMPQAAPELAGLVRDAAGAGDLEAATRLAAEIKSSELFRNKANEFAPADLLSAIKAHEADTQRFFNEAEAYQKGPKDKPFEFKPAANPLFDDVILKMLKSPAELEAGALATRIVETLKLREGLTPAELESITKLPPEQQAAAVQKLLSDPSVAQRPAVLDVLITALGRREQDTAIQASGILTAKGTRGNSNIRDVFRRMFRNPLARPAVPNP